MNRILCIILIFVIANLAFAEKDQFKSAIDEFKESFNSNDYERLFAIFSTEMQYVFTLEKTKEFISGLKFQFGDIVAIEIIEFLNDDSASYKVSFERITLLLNISMDANKKLNALDLKQFEETTIVEYAIEGIPKEISEIIFDQIRVFPNKTQISIAFIKNGKASFYGVIRENDTISSIVNYDKIFDIGSITKIFTSTVLADLVIKGNLKLEDNINKYFNFNFKDNINLSFLSLANHTSGLERVPSNLDLNKADPNNPYKDYDIAKLYSYLKDELKLQSTTGESYAYSNTGPGLLSHALELSQESNIKQLIREIIFERYNMKNSYLDIKEIKDGFIKGLDSNGNEVKNWEFDALFGTGGILTCTYDLSKFVIAHFDPSHKELALTRKSTFTIEGDREVGLGWFINRLESGRQTYGHRGGTGGHSSVILMDVENKNAIVLLSNVSSFNPYEDNIRKLVFELMDLFEE